MDLGHDTELALSVVTELVNTAPAADGSEGLPTLESLHEFIARHEVSAVPPLTLADLDEVHTIRHRLHAVFLADNVDTAAELLNAIIAEAGATPQLTAHDGHQWHIHYFAPGARLAEHLAADCAFALARLLAEGEADRLRTCEAPDCERVLVDLSKNRCRRYCDSRTCGNRLHVAAYRARQRAAALG